MSVRKLAAGRNEASVGRFLRRLDDILRDSSLAEPRKGFDEISQRTRANVGRLKNKVESVRSFISDVEKMKETGLLDEAAANAESLPARTVLSLASMLESAFERAKLADSSYPLKRVNIAVQVLAGHISLPLVSGTRYPADDARLKESLIQSRQSQAVSVHEDVCRALEGIVEVLGITIPEVPRLSELRSGSLSGS
ncbi:MAG: hypothetical protein V1861_05615 [Candidatus Micrarchaeota archaeon]